MKTKSKANVRSPNPGSPNPGSPNPGSPNPGSQGARADDATGRGASQNEGEGSQTGARHYNEDTRRFVESGRVNKAAEDAARAVDGPEGRDLRRAEEIGKRHSHGEDPELTRSSSD